MQGSHAVALAVTYLILTKQAQVLSQDSPCEICVVQTGTDTGFLCHFLCAAHRYSKLYMQPPNNFHVLSTYIDFNLQQ